MKMYKRKQMTKSLRGSFTIEISILLPMILLLLSSFIYLLFFLYDESSAVQIAYLTSLRGSIQMGSEKHKVEAANSYCMDMQEEILWAIKGKETKIDCVDSKVFVELEGEVFTPVGNRFFENNWKYRIKVSAENSMPVRIIRICRKFEREED